MKAAIATAVLQPRSLAIMKTFAMQGMKRVIVTMATTSWTTSRPPPARHVEEARGREVAAEEADQERGRGLGGQAEHALHDRLAEAGDRVEEPQPVEQRRGRRVPTRKSGSASFRYHSTRATVFESTFCRDGQAHRRQLDHEVPALAGQDARGEPPHRDHDPGHRREPDRGRRERHRGQHGQDHAELGRAGHAEGEEEGREQRAPSGWAGCAW